MERLGDVLERLGGVLEASWSVLKASWRRLGGDFKRLQKLLKIQAKSEILVTKSYIYICFDSFSHFRIFMIFK